MMIKYTLSLILLVAILNPTNKDLQSEEKILWGKKAIQWSDFKGSPPDNYDTTVGAYTVATIEISEPEYRNNIPKINVYCYFLEQESWVILKDEYSLIHERLHFDISEIYARKIRKEFDSLNKLKITDWSKYERVIEVNKLKLTAYNEAYDNAVYFNEKQQLLWGKKIHHELLKLKKFQYIP